MEVREIWVKIRIAADKVSHKSHTRECEPPCIDSVHLTRKLAASQLPSLIHRLEHCRIEKPLRAFRDGIVICPWTRDVAGAQVPGRFAGTDANYRFLDCLLRSPTGTERVEQK